MWESWQAPSSLKAYTSVISSNVDSHSVCQWNTFSIQSKEISWASSCAFWPCGAWAGGCGGGAPAGWPGGGAMYCCWPPGAPITPWGGRAASIPGITQRERTVKCDRSSKTRQCDSYVCTCLGLLKSAIHSTSRTRSFYKYLIDCLFAGNCGKGKTLLHCVLMTCEEQSISFVQYMCSDHYSIQCKRES